MLQQSRRFSIYEPIMARGGIELNREFENALLKHLRSVMVNKLKRYPEKNFRKPMKNLNELAKKSASTYG